MSIYGFVEVAHIEVAQVVQSLVKPVKLIASKRAVARVLLQPHLAKNVLVRGTLQVTFIIIGKKEKTIEIESDNSVRLQASNHPEVEKQRKTINGTLNFPLKGELLAQGNLQLKLLRLQTLHQDAVEFKDEIHDYVVHHEVPLPLRILGMRYPDSSGKIHAPRTQQFNESRYFLNRTFPMSNTDVDRPYPISTADDSDLIIEAPEGFGVPLSAADGTSGGNGGDAVWEKNVNHLHAYTMAIRGRDLDLNREPRTHYYAMIDSAGVPFYGSASDVPSDPIPGTVAAGTGQPIGRNIDHYLIGHELGHTLGRLHPGACHDQETEDGDYPYCYKNDKQEDALNKSNAKDTGCQGYISNDIEQHIGVDLTPDGSIKRLLVHDAWRDLMTYCDRKWISAYTYEGILERIRKEQALSFPVGDFIKIIGIYDLRNKSAQVLYAFPTSFNETPDLKEAGSGQLVNLILEDHNQDELRRLSVGGKRQEAKGLPDMTGVFQFTVEQDKQIVSLHVDVGSSGPPEKYQLGWLSGIDDATKDKFRVSVFRTITFADSTLNINWEGELPGSENTMYTIRVEADLRWHTIYLGNSLLQEVHLDSNVFKFDEDYKVQITLSDGFEEIDLFDGVVPHISPVSNKGGTSHEDE
jgi:hypothetical protein